jgi:hypothetical protein
MERGYLVLIIGDLQGLFASGIGFGLALLTFEGVLSSYSARLLRRGKSKRDVMATALPRPPEYAKLAGTLVTYEVTVNKLRDVFYKIGIAGVVVASLNFLLLFLSAAIPSLELNIYLSSFVVISALLPVLLAIWLVAWLWMAGFKLQRLL